MKQAARIFYAMAITCMATMPSCVNEIRDNEIREGNIPINFSIEISKSSSSTRVENNAFEAGDQVGLFGILTGSSIEKNRYIDNLKLMCNDKTTLLAEREVFYPEGNATLDFISYYPYTEESIAEGSTVLPVAVQADQRDNSLSDFMVAIKKNVGSSNEPVELTFKHKFSRLRIEMLPQGKETAEDMKSDNPRIILTGFKTQAGYDMAEDKFTDLSDEKDIILSGEWSVSDNKLTGIEAIVIPQTVSGQTIEIEWNGKIYTSPVPLNSLTSSKQYTIQIEATELTDNTLASISCGIEDWESANEEGDNSCQNDHQLNAVHISALSFKSSNIYRVYQGGDAVAEICQEYLKSTNGSIDSRAIVAYPVKNGETILTKGTVLQLLDETSDTHGGKLCWDTETNTPDYTAGTSAPISKIFFDQEGEMALTQPENPAKVNVSSYLLRDLRKGILQTYSIVKIGTQYWMREELKTTLYRNGDELAEQTKIGEGAGYFLSENGKMYFYNGEALLANELAPQGWRIPRTSDWSRLEEYVGNAAALKKGSWNNYEEGYEVAPVTNLSYFCAYPVGVWLSTHMCVNEMVGYWSTDETGKQIPEKTSFMLGEYDTIQQYHTLSEGKDYYKALAIRCLKE